MDDVGSLPVCAGGRWLSHRRRSRGFRFSLNDRVGHGLYPMTLAPAQARGVRPHSASQYSV